MKKWIAALALLAGATGVPAAAQDNYLGEIILNGYNFCQRTTATTTGTLLPISSNTALFSLIGTTYGGDGRTSFALPELRGRIAMHLGQGPGLSNRTLGEKGGVESTTLIALQMPSHTHLATAVISGLSGVAASGSPAGALFGAALGASYYGAAGGTTVAMANDMLSVTLANAGGNQPVGIVNPNAAINYCIVTQGVYPSRD